MQLVVFFKYAEDDGKLGVELNIREYENTGNTQNAVYILLDALLGEYDVVNEIDWIKLDEKKIESLNPLIDLREMIDERKNKTV